jgi:adenine-specific DNA-methyltransferase
MPKKKTVTKKQVDALVHDDAKRRNIPTAEFESVMSKDDQTPIQIAYERRNRDLDPQLVWRGKDEQDWSDLVVAAPPLYIQEKVHPKVLIEDLLRRTEKNEVASDDQLDLFGDFNGLPNEDAKTEFYQHDSNWTNRMILGDSLQVMASLAEREGLRGKVQCIYFDPPYGIKFNSNFQWSTTSRDVKDGKQEHITREPEMVKAFRDTWRDGIHTYMTYLRDRLTVARDLLTDSGSIFVQIGDGNVHRVRALMDEVFGEDNFVCEIVCAKTSSSSEDLLSSVADYVLWFSKAKKTAKYRQLFHRKVAGAEGGTGYRRVMNSKGESRPATKEELSAPKTLKKEWRLFASDNVTSQRPQQGADLKEFHINGIRVTPGKGTFKTDYNGLTRLNRSCRLLTTSGSKPAYIRYIDDFPVFAQSTLWTDTLGQNQFAGEKIYVVQTAITIVQRCMLMATDPGDLVLDPTCGSGTTAFVAEQWGRRWITIDTSRVALALARARIMGAKYPFYLLSDSKEGQQKEAELTRNTPSESPVYGNIRQGFVYERVPHIMLSSISRNAEIDVIWEEFQTHLEPLREQLNQELGTQWEEWGVPREADGKWSAEAKQLHANWWAQRITRQKEIDASIAAKVDQEFLYDKPYDDKKRVRVAGPFTVESLSPHRTLGVDEDDELIDPAAQEKGPGNYNEKQDFASMILENLKTAGVQQAHKEGKIKFTALQAWPGDLVCAEGTYSEGEDGTEKRAAIFIGPEFGTVARADLVAAAREAGDANFDVLIACAFNYEARTTEFDKLGRLPVLKARMNADLHMADELKNTGAGNLFVIFGEPDIDLLPDDHGKVRVKVNGVDVFKPQLGRVESSNTDEIACWFIDTDYNEESFFVRHAYFLGAADPYKSLRTTLKAEINPEAWETLYSDISRPFDKPSSGRIAVKVINHLGDEVMKVFKI